MLKGQLQNFGEMRRRIREDPQGAKFFDPSKPHRFGTPPL
jgi:hypothetical protein